MCRGLKEFLVAPDLFGGEAADIRPCIVGQIADSRMKTILRVRFFKVDLYALVRKHFRMNNLGVVVQCHKRIHHEKSLPVLFS